jgi:hypothetical protein
MMILNRYLTSGIIALVIIGLFFVVGCVQQSAPQTQTISVRYHYTNEGSYYDALIDGSVILFKHTDTDTEEKCAQWILQSPCWTEEDLVIEKSQLTAQERDDFINLIEETGILQSESYYGPAQGERCYAYTLKISEKEITYCSRPGGPAQPEAFAKVSGKIQEIVAQKFS